MGYQICYLFKALGKQEKYKKLQGVCDDASWLMQQFAEMLHVPRYALIKRCPLGDNEDFDFHPLIYEEKVYSREFYSCDIRVTNCNDDSLITTLTGHTVSLFTMASCTLQIIMELSRSRSGAATVSLLPLEDILIWQ